MPNIEQFKYRMNLILIKQSRDGTHVNRDTTELFETYILTSLFETKTILSLFNNHYYYYMAKAIFGRIMQYIRRFVVRLLA